MLSKSQARAFFLGGTGIFSAAFLALTIDTHRKVPEQTNEQNLTPQVIAGKKIWEDNNCMGCHTLFGEGAYYAPELTKIVEEKGKTYLKDFIKDPEKYYPNRRRMVKYDFTDEQIDDVLAFLEWCGEVDLNGFPAPPPLKPAPMVLSESALPPPKIFEICSACHSVGGKGGNVGPALDQVAQKMGRAELTEWIRDPQKVKPGTGMPNLGLSEENLTEVVTYLLSLSGKN